MLASDVMDTAAAALNDTAKAMFTYTAQIPYLNMAIRELDELCQLNNVSISNATSSAVVVTTAMTDIGGATGPSLPGGLVEIQGLYERTNGTNESYLEMSRREFLPELIPTTTNLEVWAWMNEVIQFIGATSDRQVKIHYISSRLPNIINSTDPIAMINAQSFLGYRTAALCAEFIGENKSRADSLNGDASIALDRSMGINIKGKQEWGTRRRPFMAGYKSRCY